MSSNRRVVMNVGLLGIGVVATIIAVSFDLQAELGGKFLWQRWCASALIATIAFGLLIVIGGNKVRWAGFICLACFWFLSYRAAEQFLRIVAN